MNQRLSYSERAAAIQATVKTGLAKPAAAMLPGEARDALRAIADLLADLAAEIDIANGDFDYDEYYDEG
jgi:hypothetical protein